MNGEATGSWRGEIRDSKVVRQPDDPDDGEDVDEEDEPADPARRRSGRSAARSGR
jgi:hypothetical protein